MQIPPGQNQCVFVSGMNGKLSSSEGRPTALGASCTHCRAYGDCPYERDKLVKGARALERVVFVNHSIVCNELDFVYPEIAFPVDKSDFCAKDSVCVSKTGFDNTWI